MNKMKRKRLIKLLMAADIPRNEAEVYANACNGSMPHVMMWLLVMTQPQLRMMVSAMLTKIRQGTKLEISFDQEEPMVGMEEGE